MRERLLMAQAAECTDITEVVNTDVDATPVLKKCVDSHRGHSLELPPGRYLLKTRLRIKGPISLKTKGKSSPCLVNDPNCAQFIAANETDLSEAIPQQFGVVHLEGQDVAMQSVIINGDRHNRYNQAGFAACQSGNGIAGTLLSADLKSGLIEGVVLKNAICGTGLVVWIGATDMLIRNNTVYSNGDITRQRGWADGMTIHDGHRLRIRNNAFIDNSDVQLVFGGCRDCYVTDNTFSHGQDPRQAAFAELVLHSWQDGTSGDFNGTVVAQNEIDCGPKFLCGHGLALGADAWYTE